MLALDLNISILSDSLFNVVDIFLAELFLCLQINKDHSNAKILV